MSNQNINILKDPKSVLKRSRQLSDIPEMGVEDSPRKKEPTKKYFGVKLDVFKKMTDS